METGVKPVFLKKRDVKDLETEESRVGGLEICVAAEREAGRGAVVGCQEVRGLFRIYCGTESARNKLLTQGIVIRDCSFQLSNQNPFILSGGSENERPTTKLTIADIPLSVANSEIEHSLVRTGVELRSGLKMECYRDTDGKLTRFSYGKTVCFYNSASDSP